MKKRWVHKEKVEKGLVQEVSKTLNISEILAELLIQRGISDFDSAKNFFRPSLDNLHDPFLMQDMDKAVARILKAIEKGERILVYGDYDVDGTTSVALLYSFLNHLTPHISYYIPDRYHEGYGISFQGIDFAADNEMTLIVALDCGIKANDKVAYANKKNIDFIICDHHLPGDTLPEAVAVLDPKRADCNYPFKELSGCGIGFKLVQAIALKKQIAFKELFQYLDLVAVSIAADIVPIVDENRVLSFYGLRRINQHPREGFKAIMKLAKAKKSFNNMDLVFIIGPRINAAGRLETGNKAVELLISDNAYAADISGQTIDYINSSRKVFDSNVTQEAVQMIENNAALKTKKTTVLYCEHWHKGVVGIVASRLIENHYYRPTIILTQSNDMVTGSARSVKHFDVYQAIAACEDLLEQFGGHKYAAGLTLKPDNVKAFQEKFESVVAQTINADWLIPEIEMDAEINFTDITPNFYTILKQFEPFGPQNLSPIFFSKNVFCVEEPKIVGEKHLKMLLSQKGKTAINFSAIAFQQADALKLVKKGQFFNICYHIEENEWDGKITLQLNIQAIQVA